MKASEILIHADGGSRGNPGPAAAGVLIEISAEKVRLLCGKYLGVNTNNFAEYHGVILGLTKALELLGENSENSVVKFNLDSALIVNQLNGLFKLKAANLVTLFFEVRALEKNFSSVHYKHVRREYNREADKAVNKALDSGKDFEEKF
jgi:ribonuclease HI